MSTETISTVATTTTTEDRSERGLLYFVLALVVLGVAGMFAV